MRYVEIILKLAFLVTSVFLIVTRDIFSPIFSLLLIICIVLGLVLMLNKKASYNFRQTKKDLKMRQVEGGILVLFAAIVSGLGL